MPGPGKGYEGAEQRHPTQEELGPVQWVDVPHILCGRIPGRVLLAFNAVIGMGPFNPLAHDAFRVTVHGSHWTAVGLRVDGQRSAEMLTVNASGQVGQVVCQFHQARRTIQRTHGISRIPRRRPCQSSQRTDAWEFSPSVAWAALSTLGA